MSQISWNRSYSCICLFGKMSQMLWRQKLQLYLSIWEDVADVIETEVTAVSVYLGKCRRCYGDRSYRCIWMKISGFIGSNEYISRRPKETTGSSFILSSLRSFINSFIHSFINSSIYLSIYLSYICLCIYPWIYSSWYLIIFLIFNYLIF